jgi:hypothetical protein
VSTEQLQYHNVKDNESEIYSATCNDRWQKIMAHTTQIRQYGIVSHHVSKKEESRQNSIQKQIRVAFWFPLQSRHSQPVTWHSFLHTGGQEADFVHSFLSPMRLGLANSDYQLFGSLKKYEMPALQDQSQSDKLHNWLHNVTTLECLHLHDTGRYTWVIQL